jgi:hypothetical protein
MSGERGDLRGALAVTVTPRTQRKPTVRLRSLHEMASRAAPRTSRRRELYPPPRPIARRTS